MLTSLILKVIWFHLPAGAANIAPVIMAKVLPLWDLPVDLGWSLKGKRLFGNNKTIRGLISGVLLSIIIFSLQKFISHTLPFFQQVEILDYQKLSPFLLGTIMGIGGLGGDLIKSFFKRRLSIPPGKSWIPFDQVDWIIGNLLMTLFFINHSLEFVITSLIIGFVLSLLTRLMGYSLGLSRQPI